MQNVFLLVSQIKLEYISLSSVIMFSIFVGLLIKFLDSVEL